MPLEIRSLQAVDICKVERYHIFVENVNNLLREHQETVLPHGTIAHLGPINATLHVYVYQFEDTARCSDASNCNFTGVAIVHDDSNYIKTFLLVLQET